MAIWRIDQAHPCIHAPRLAARWNTRLRLEMLEDRATPCATSADEPILAPIEPPDFTEEIVADESGAEFKIEEDACDDAWLQRGAEADEGYDDSYVEDEFGDEYSDEDTPWKDDFSWNEDEPVYLLDDEIFYTLAFSTQGAGDPEPPVEMFNTPAQGEPNSAPASVVDPLLPALVEALNQTTKVTPPLTFVPNDVAPPSTLPPVVATVEKPFELKSARFGVGGPVNDDTASHGPLHSSNFREASPMASDPLPEMATNTDKSGADPKDSIVPLDDESFSDAPKAEERSAAAAPAVLNEVIPTAVESARWSAARPTAGRGGLAAILLVGCLLLIAPGAARWQPWLGPRVAWTRRLACR